MSMVSHKISTSCGIISRIRNTLDIKSIKMIYFSLMHHYLTNYINVLSSTYRTNLKTLCTAQKRSVRTLFPTAQQPNSRDIFINQKNLPLDKLINQQEGVLAYQVINGTYLLNDFLNHGDVRHQIEHRNIGDLRIPLYTAILSIFVRYRAINTWNGLSGDCAAHHHSLLSRINYDSCICLSHSFQMCLVSMIIKLLSSSTEVTMQYS